MPNLHFINIVLHVSAGCLALMLGLAILMRKKGTSTHRKLGKLFCYSGFAVCFFAATGLVFFKFMPLFTALLFLVFYQVVSGWRIAVAQAAGPSQPDAAWTLMAAAVGTTLGVWLWKHPDSNHAGPYGTLGALALVLAYDAGRWLFPKRWHASLWRYEHLYKMVSSIFGMMSAFVGSIEPASQI